MLDDRDIRQICQTFPSSKHPVPVKLATVTKSASDVEVHRPNPAEPRSQYATSPFPMCGPLGFPGDLNHRASSKSAATSDPLA